MRFLKKVGGRGNVVLPSELREAMDIGEGDIVEFEVIGIVRRGTRKETKTEQPGTASGTTA